MVWYPWECVTSTELSKMTMFNTSIQSLYMSVYIYICIYVYITKREEEEEGGGGGGRRNNNDNILNIYK